MSELLKELDELESQAKQCAQDRAELLRLVKLALKINPLGSPALRGWQAEAEATLKRMEGK